MTVEQLLKPRYKVIAAYPLSHLYFKVGDIFEQLEHGGFATNGTTHLGMNEETIKEYPHIFKPLAWYEEREIKDLPEYVKSIRSAAVTHVGRWQWLADKLYFEIKDTGHQYEFPKESFEPATETEYQTYLNGK